MILRYGYRWGTMQFPIFFLVYVILLAMYSWQLLSPSLESLFHRRSILSCVFLRRFVKLSVEMFIDFFMDLISLTINHSHWRLRVPCIRFQWRCRNSGFIHKILFPYEVGDEFQISSSNICVHSVVFP